MLHEIWRRPILRFLPDSLREHRQQQLGAGICHPAVWFLVTCDSGPTLLLYILRSLVGSLGVHFVEFQGLVRILVELGDTDRRQTLDDCIDRRCLCRLLGAAGGSPTLPT